jgi:hypothetical protein
MYHDRARLALCLGGAGGRAGANRPDDLKVIEAAASAPGTPFQVLQRRRDDPRRIAHHQERTVGNFTRQLNGFRAGGGHEHRDVSPRRVLQPAR